MSSKLESFTDAEIDELVKEFDFLRLSCTDLHGRPQVKYVPAYNAKNVFKNGTGLEQGLPTSRGPNYQFGITKENFIEFKYQFSGNGLLIPVRSTYRIIPWLGGDYKVADVLAEMHLSSDKSLIVKSPRAAARKQIDSLHEMGYKLFSSCELEFCVFENDRENPLTAEGSPYEHLAFAKNEKALLGLVKNLEEIGIQVDCIHGEYAAGQFEAPLKPCFGIQGADTSVAFQSAVREYLSVKHNLDATFMSLANYEEMGSSCHFNHSLWTADGQNAFWDPSAEDNLSEVAKHWIAGLLEHMPAMTALCLPTVNCYERLDKVKVMQIFGWGIEERKALLRIKNSTHESTYIENRLPGAGVNPYLLYVANISAGLDGIKRKLKLGQPLSEAPKIPKSLPEAIDALEKDSVIREAIGEELFTTFKFAKLEIELKEFENKAKQCVEAIVEQRKMYF